MESNYIWGPFQYVVGSRKGYPTENKDGYLKNTQTQKRIGNECMLFFYFFDDENNE